MILHIAKRFKETEKRHGIRSKAPQTEGLDVHLMKSDKKV